MTWRADFHHLRATLVLEIHNALASSKTRHYMFGADGADWPTVDLPIPSHNEEAVTGNCRQASSA